MLLTDIKPSFLENPGIFFISDSPNRPEIPVLLLINGIYGLIINIVG
jgi:hypothetical protein